MCVALQNTLKLLSVRGIPAKDLTVDNLRKGLQQQPQKWVPAACQLIKAAPAACQAALSADEALVTGLAAHLAKACSGSAASRAPSATWVEGAGALSQLLTLDCPVELEVDTILPIYIRCLQHRHAAVLDLTSYLLKWPATTDAVFQHPTLLLDLLQQLEAASWTVTDHNHSDLITTGVIGIIITSSPAQVAAHAPFQAKLLQLLASGHAGAAHVLSALSHVDSGRQLITSQPQLLAALAGALQGPNAAWPKMLLWLIGLVRLASSPDSSAVVLADPTCCRALVEGMVAAMRNASQLGTCTCCEMWGWLEKLVGHEPSRQVLLTWRPEQQAPGVQGAGQGAAPPPPAPAAIVAAELAAADLAAAAEVAIAAAAAGGNPEMLPLDQLAAAAAGAFAAAQGLPGAAAPAGGAGGAAAAGGGSSFLATLATALLRIPPGGEAAAGTVFSTLLGAAEDTQQLLEALEVPRWLSTLWLERMPRDAWPAWATAIELLLRDAAGKAALWAAPRLVQGVIQLASETAIVDDAVRHRWRVLRDVVRPDASYQAALLQGLRVDNPDWVSLVMAEMNEVVLNPGLRRHDPSTYSVLAQPGLAEALAEGCRQQGPSSMWRLLRQLLQTRAGQAVFDGHPPLVGAAASRFARAEGSSLDQLLQDLESTSVSPLKEYVLGRPQLLRGVVMGAVGARRLSTCALYTTRLATKPWFSSMVEGDGEVLDALLRALGPVAQQQQQQHQQHLQWMMGHNSPSCQEAVLAQLNKEALFPKLLQRLSSPGDMKLVQGAWNGLDWLRRSGAPWDQDVPRALGNMVKAAGRAGELPQLQLQVTQTAVQLAQEHVALREQRQQLEAARAQLAAAGGGGTGGGAAAEAGAAPQRQQPQQQQATGEQQVQGGGRKRRQQRGKSGTAAAAASQPSSKKARKR
jgi:hypothetical protein